MSSGVNCPFLYYHFVQVVFFVTFLLFFHTWLMLNDGSFKFSKLGIPVLYPQSSFFAYSLRWRNTGGPAGPPQSDRNFLHKREVTTQTTDIPQLGCD